MPNYDYECRECAGKFEKNVPMNERDTQACDCGGELRRLISFYGTVWSPTSSGANHS